MHGRQATSVWTIAAWIARGPGSGEVAHSRVGPKMATTGTSTAAARCIAPESFETNARHRDNTPASAGRSVLPARSIITPGPAPAAPAVRTTVWTVSRSAAAPTATTHAPGSFDRRAASAPIRSGGQRFAHPYAAPGATPGR